MTRIVVTSCGDCPFADTASDTAYVCSRVHRVASVFGDDAAPARPDWCPLEQGPVEVTLDRCNDELSGLHCILPPHGTDVAHRAPTVPSDPETSVLVWDDEGRVVTVDDKAKTREGGA